MGRRGLSAEQQHPLEFHNHVFYRYLYEFFGMRFRVSIDKAERLFWDAAAPGVAAPGMFPICYTGCHHRTDVRIPGWSGVAPADPCLEMEAWSDMIHVLDSLG